MTIEIIQALPDTPAMAACYKLRLEVFVKEQGVPADEELDALDASSLHVLALCGGEPAGTARAFEKSPGIWKIGRVAVAEKFRKAGIGQVLMRGIEELCPAKNFALDAQTHALRFYEKLGYKAEGSEFMDAGIPHFHMRKTSGH